MKRELSSSGIWISNVCPMISQSIDTTRIPSSVRSARPYWGAATSLRYDRSAENVQTK